MRGALRSWVRLLALQASWNFERMQGIGMGHAAEPLLRDLQVMDPARHTEATVRSADFFNAHPYLAGLALGALARAELDGAPEEQIVRLRKALCGPLGAMGDQIFWAGLLPALMAAALVLAVLGAPWIGVAVFLGGFNLVRLAVSRWALARGLSSGLMVGAAIARSWLPRWMVLAAPVAAALVGAALPLTGAWLLEGFGPGGVAAALVIALAGTLLVRWIGSVLTPVRFALLAALLTVIWHRVAG